MKDGHLHVWEDESRGQSETPVGTGATSRSETTDLSENQRRAEKSRWGNDEMPNPEEQGKHVFTKLILFSFELMVHVKKGTSFLIRKHLSNMPHADVINLIRILI